MTPVAVVSFGAVSALGEGRDAAGVGNPGDAPRVAIARDDELERAGLARPFVGRVPFHAARAGASSGLSSGASGASAADRAGPASSADRARVFLERALVACMRDLDRARPGWRAQRIGLALGTSSGGMRQAERLFTAVAAGAPPADPASATYFAPMAQAVAASGVAFQPATLVLAACAASTFAIGIGARWIEAGECDLVLAGGFDALSVFVASGFEVLRATTGEIPPRPFRVGRDGMSLGEGAAILALAPAQAAAQLAGAPVAGAAADGRAQGNSRPLGYVAGFGASADAVHLTAPDRTGEGLARAASRALADAAVVGAAIDLVSAHATSTPFNDAAEAKALARALGPSARPVIQPLKAQIGHTLGAAGALESLACIDALERKILPGAAATGEIEPELGGRLLERAEAGAPRLALKLSAAFGGANAALVWAGPNALPARAGSRAPRAPPAFRDAYVTRAVAVDMPHGDLADLAALSQKTGVAVDKLQRGDGLVRAALSALADLEAREGSLRGAGIVVGHALATLETNYVYHSRMAARGVRSAEPRRFPYTSPNAVAGECGVAFGLTGPGLAVGSGLHGAIEALAIASLLVRAGDADRMVVLAVDELGPASAAALPAFGDVDLRSGAAALLVTFEPTGYARIGAVELRNGASDQARVASAAAPRAVGHRALLPLTAETAPAEVHASSPAVAGGAVASARVTLST